MEKDLFKIKLEIYQNKYGNLNDKEVSQMKTIAKQN